MPLLGVFALALAGSLAATPLARRLAWRLGVTAQPAANRYHSRPTPLLGGLAIYAAVMLVTAGTAGRTEVRELAGILGGASLVALLGAWDDSRPLSPYAKLAGEAVAAGGLLLAGVQVTLLGQRLGGGLGAAADLALTLLWVVALTNAANLLDNMDGALAGVTLVAATAIALLAQGSGQLLVAPLAAALAGACLGFLAFNRSPASIFMGDAGSLFLGFLLAALGIKLRFPGQSPSASWMVPVLVLGVPLFDTLLVVVSRLRRGLNPLKHGGKDHLAHRLVARGASPREAVQALWLLGCAAAALGLYVGRLDRGDAVPAWLALALALAAMLWGLWELEGRPDAKRRLE